VKALILKKVRYGESDLIVHFLLESNVQLKGFAVGARHSHRRYPHRFDLSGLYELELSTSAEANRLIRLGKVELLEFASSFRTDLALMTRWSMILEWLAYEEVVSHSFEQVVALRRDLQEGRLESFHRFFWQIILNEGVTPSDEQCSVCHKDQGRAQMVFSPQGFCHSNCGSGVELTEDCRQWIWNQLNVQDRPACFNSAILANLDEITLPYLQQQLGRSLKSFQFFEQLRFGKPIPDQEQSSSASPQREASVASALHP